MVSPLNNSSALSDVELASRVFAQVCHSEHLSLKEAKELFERTYIELTLEKLNGQKLKTAQALGISRKRLWEMMRAWVNKDAITTAAAVVLGAGAGWLTGTVASAWL